ncbi:cytochrome P450 6j1-like [Schistocerca cancellata]|uniref:cytochrome P450 6j1-like n=1 Tax=Schistocerca cancellata TaxID=274614 RepID=UPI002117CFBE|nr:cytochrome P450 6j1-like [Schistocerca cancellata]
MTLVTGSWLLDAALPLLLVPLLYWYATRNFDYWKKLGIPYMKPIPYVGNMGSVVIGRKHMGEPVFECYRRAGDAPFMGMFAFDKPILLVKDPALIGRIMTTDFSTFYATNAKIDPVTDPVFATSLFGQHGAGWRKLRTSLTPAFTSGKMKLMFHLLNETGQKLGSHLESAASKGTEVELKDVMARYTTDAVCSIFMGVDANSLENPKSPLREHVRRILRETVVGRIITTLAFFAPQILSALRIRLGSKKVEDFFVQNTVKLIEHRKETGIVRNYIIDMLTKIKEEQPEGDNEQLTDVVLVCWLRQLVFDAAFTLFELAWNQSLQEEVRQHVRHVLSKHGGHITYEAVNEMTDLTNVVSETQRKYPTVNFLNREASRDYRIEGTDIVLPKGTAVFVSVAGLHSDPKYWKEPLRFWPDRFREENSRDRPSHTFMPFGEGPRTCIGMRLAYMQVKVVLVHILNNFEVHPAPSTPTTLRYHPSRLVGTPAGNLSVLFKKTSCS